MTGFSFARFLKLLKLEVRARQTELGLFALAAPALYLVSQVFRFSLGQGVGDWPTWAFLLALILGLFVTNRAFQMESNPATSPFALMLPATRAEKYAAKLLLSLGLFFALELVALTVLANVIGGVSALLGGSEPRLLLPPPETFTKQLPKFIAFHSLVFCGAAFFKGNVFAKTLATLVAYGCVVGAVMVVLSLSGGLAGMLENAGAIARGGVPGDGFNRILLVVEWAWQGVMPLFLYAASYFRLEEKEVA